MTLPQTRRFGCLLLPAAVLLLAGSPAGLAVAQAGDAAIAGNAQGNASLLAAAAAPAAFSGLAAATFAGAATSTTASSSQTSSSAAALPDAPSAVMLAAYATPSAYGPQNPNPYNPKNRPAGARVAPRYSEYIPAGWAAQPITARDKVIIGLRDTYSPLTLLGELVTTGYSQALNGQPNYGTDRGAFGQRLGASVIRDTSEGIFTDSIFSPLLHEDPRYYVEGPSYGFFHRVIYAATRPLLTRTDSGHRTINAAELLGYAGASALSYTYYPPINQNFKDTAATFGDGLGASALGYIVSEFADQALQAVHLEKRH